MEPILQIPPDDVLDVTELATTIELSIDELLDGIDLNICKSAVMMGFINCLINLSNSKDDLLFYREVLQRAMDRAIDEPFLNFKDPPDE